MVSLAKHDSIIKYTIRQLRFTASLTWCSFSFNHFSFIIHAVIELFVDMLKANITVTSPLLTVIDSCRIIICSSLFVLQLAVFFDMLEYAIKRKAAIAVLCKYLLYLIASLSFIHDLIHTLLGNLKYAVRLNKCELLWQNERKVTSLHWEIYSFFNLT